MKVEIKKGGSVCKIDNRIDHPDLWVVREQGEFKIMQIPVWDGQELRKKAVETGVVPEGMPCYWWTENNIDFELWPTASHNCTIRIEADYD